MSFLSAGHFAPILPQFVLVKSSLFSCWRNLAIFGGWLELVEPAGLPWGSPEIKLVLEI